MLPWLLIFYFFSYFQFLLIIITIAMLNLVAFICLNLVPWLLGQYVYLHQMSHPIGWTFTIIFWKFHYLNFQFLCLEIDQIASFLLRRRLFVLRVCLAITGIGNFLCGFKEFLWNALRYGFGRSCLDTRCWTLVDEFAGLNIHFEIQKNRYLKLIQNFKIVNL